MWVFPYDNVRRAINIPSFTVITQSARPSRKRAGRNKKWVWPEMTEPIFIGPDSFLSFYGEEGGRQHPPLASKPPSAYRTPWSRGRTRGCSSGAHRRLARRVECDQASAELCTYRRNARFMFESILHVGHPHTLYRIQYSLANFVHVFGKKNKLHTVRVHRG